MAIPSFALREFFHLALLRHLSARLSGRSWAVKGDVCLRFFHRSPRLSEDMDLDVSPVIRLRTLEEGIDGILASRAFSGTLLPAGITQVRASKPKQTETTQRWKVLLSLGGGEPLATKVEFSRRRQELDWVSGIPDAPLLAEHRFSPFGAQFYPAGAMAAQKIAALASPARNALRDLFDLDHLFTTLGTPRSEIEVAKSAAEAAAEKADGFRWQDFRDQVVPYLTVDLMDHYRDPQAFKALKDRVVTRLLGMLE